MQLRREAELVGGASRAGDCDTQERVETFQFWVESKAGQQLPARVDIVQRMLNHSTVTVLAGVEISKKQ